MPKSLSQNNHVTNKDETNVDWVGKIEGGGRHGAKCMGNRTH